MAKPKCPQAERWQAHLSGTLPSEEQRELTEHLDQCAACQKTLDNLSRASGVQAAQGSETVAFDRPVSDLEHTDAEELASSDAARPIPEGLEFLAPSSNRRALGKLGAYEVLEVLGRGRLGVVLRARDPRLERIVAIKVLVPELARQGAVRQRFLREAQAAAHVVHSNVVVTHAVEETGALPFVVMQMVAGGSLKEKLKSDGPLEIRAVVNIGMQLARGLAAAHHKGVLHRDLRPANVLLDGGIEKVKITDFGVALALEEVSDTKTGMSGGLSAYASPEQACGEAVDARSDLFSLGSLLYAMCTGRSPFRATDSQSVQERLRKGKPRPIGELRPETPAWLVKLIERLHAKDPARRYQSAEEVANLLEEQHMLTTATAQRPVRRKRALKRGISVVLLCFFGLAVTGFAAAWLNGWFTSEPQPDQPVHPGVNPKPEPVAKVPPAKKPAEEWVSLFDGKSLKGWKTHPEFPGKWELKDGILIGRGPEFGYLFTDRGDYRNLHVRAEVKVARGGVGGLLLRTEYGFNQFRGYPRCIDVNITDDRRFSQAGSIEQRTIFDERRVKTDEWFVLEAIARDNRIETLIDGRPVLEYADDLRDRVQGHIAMQIGPGCTELYFRRVEIRELPDETQPVSIVDLRLADIPEIDRLVAGKGNLKNVPPELVAIYGSSRLSHVDEIKGLAIAPDGRQFVTAGTDGLVHRWDANTGARLGLLVASGKPLTSAAYSRDGRWIAAGDMDGTAHVWDAQTKALAQQSTSLPAHRGSITQLVFAADGSLLTATSQGQIKKCNPQTRAAYWAIDDLAGKVAGLALSPDGRRLASLVEMGKDRAVAQIWDPVTGKLQRTLSLQPAPGGITFLSDSLLAIASAEGDVVIVEVDQDKVKHRLPFKLNTVLALAAHPNGKRLAIADVDTVKIWDVEKATPTAQTKSYTKFTRHVAFTPDGRRLITGRSYAATVWNADTLAQLLAPTISYVNGVSFRPDGKELAFGPGAAGIWDPLTKQRLKAFGVYHAAIQYSPDGRFLATSGDATFETILWDAVTKAKLHTLKGHTGDVWSLSFSKDGNLLATCSRDKSVKVWNTATGEELASLPLHASGVCAAMHPAGKLVAVSCQSGDETKGDVQVWDWQAKEIRRHLKGHKEVVWWLAFHPDGNALLTGSHDKLAMLWRGNNYQSKDSLAGHTSGIVGVAFSPDGKLMATRGYDRRLIIRDARTLTTLLTLTLPSAGHRIAFAPDNRHIAATFEAGVVHLYRIPPNEKLLQGQRVEMKVNPAEAHVKPEPAGTRLVDGSKVYSAAFDPEGKLLVTGSYDGPIHLWTHQGSEWKNTGKLPGHRGAVRSFAFSPNGNLLASGGEDGALRLWKKERNAWVPGFVLPHAENVYGIAFSPDGNRIYTASSNWLANRTGALRAWNVSTGQELPLFQNVEPKKWACITLSPDGSTLATGCHEKVVQIWDARTGQLKQTLPEHDGFVHSVRFSPDGKRLVSAGADKFLRVWSKKDDAWQIERDIPHQVGTGFTIAFAGKGNLVAICGWPIQLLDIESGHVVATLHGHRNRTDGLAFTPDGNLLISGSWDATIRQWMLKWKQ